MVGSLPFVPGTTMPRASTAAARPRNRILAALPDEEYARIAPHLEPVTLQVRDLIHDIDQPITHVYFVNSGVASVVSIMAAGNAVETATIGYEGMVGLAVFHHADRTAAQAFCQVAGDALRMPSDAFRSEIAHAPALRGLLHRYTQALLAGLGVQPDALDPPAMRALAAADARSRGQRRLRHHARVSGPDARR